MSFLPERPAIIQPGYDVFQPARRSDRRGIVLGSPLDGGHSYVPWIGISTIRELALKHRARTGVVDAAELDAVVGILEDTERELAQARERLAELEATQERITGLAKSGFRIQRTQGRTTKKVIE